MPSIKDLKKRIGTVKNTQQTTRAMKMVSAAKLRRSQEAILSHRPYAKRISDLIQKILGGLKDEEKVSHQKFLKRDKVGAEEQSKKVLLVVVTSDRGLCGGFNSAIIKATQRWLQANPGIQAELAFVGRKGYDFFKARNLKIGTFYQELGGKVTFAKAKKLANDLVDRYVKEEVDEVKIIYNEFKNAVTQKVMIEDFLPLSESGVKTEASESASASESPDYIVKPSAQVVLQELLERNFATQTFRVMLESQAGEHGARMSAMENATKNAGEMIRKLTLQYNKQRQAGITKELLEIIAGSESQKG